MTDLSREVKETTPARLLGSVVGVVERNLERGAAKPSSSANQPRDMEQDDPSPTPPDVSRKVPSAENHDSSSCHGRGALSSARMRRARGSSSSSGPMSAATKGR